jgi:two-component system response regulator RegA
MTQQELNTRAVKHLLIVEDDQGLSNTLALEFADRGYQVSQISSATELSFPETVVFDAALVDLKLKSESGLVIVEKLHRLYKDCRIVILTGYGSIATAVKAVKLGATNYLTKPASAAQIEAALSAHCSGGCPQIM